MAELPPDLAPVTQGELTDTNAQSLTPVSDVMAQGVQDATGDFITSMIQLLESKGIDLDDIMKESTEDKADLAEGDVDPLQLLTEEELIMLVQKFEALEPQVKAQLEQAFIQELDPRFVKRLRAVQRFVQGRQG